VHVEAGSLEVLTKSKDTILVLPAANTHFDVQVGIPVRRHCTTTAQSFVQLPCGQNAQECVDAPEKSDAMLVNSRETKVGVAAAPFPPGRELNGPWFEKNGLRCGFYAKAGWIRAPTNEDLIGGQIWDRQEHLELERQEARGVGKGTIGLESLFENLDVGSFEVELKTAIRDARGR
jgi:hypothetical protein